jgi:acyl-CoA dehydrogenase
MSIDLVADTVDRILTEHCPAEIVAQAEGSWAPGIWQRLEDAGLTKVGIPETSGGMGGAATYAAVIVRVSARHAAPLPLAETAMLAGWACAAAGLEMPDGPITIAYGADPSALRLHRSEGGGRLDGTAHRVPWASVATRIAVVASSNEGPALALVEPAICHVDRGSNLAGEPRDDLRFTAATIDPARVGVLPPDAFETLRLRGALARSVQLAGALEAVLDLTVIHANQREQFGRPIGRFQAVQQQIALLAGEVAAASAAVAGAVRAEGGSGFPRAVAAAKIRAGMAAGTAARIAHQVHGAIGFTQEHRLHHLTRRLWSWRDEFGSEAEWARQLGAELAAAGPEQLWPTLCTN